MGWSPDSLLVILQELFVVLYLNLHTVLFGCQMAFPYRVEKKTPVLAHEVRVMIGQIPKITQ
jgi:hypothetical protein